MSRIEWRETYSANGTELNIVAVEEGKNEWSLYIENEHGIKTHWDDFFMSADAALVAGRSAIQREGVDAFAGLKDFEYLQDERLSAAIKDLLKRRNKDS